MTNYFPSLLVFTLKATQGVHSVSKLLFSCGQQSTVIGAFFLYCF